MVTPEHYIQRTEIDGKDVVLVLLDARGNEVARRVWEGAAAYVTNAPAQISHTGHFHLALPSLARINVTGK